tara:strand:- start:6 stop:620 length:615 start_codon:yes stop_codon:yes gene_type:complete
MSKLKTVWDAVNELRGNLNNTPNFSGGEMYLFHFVNHDRIGSSYGKHGLDGVINHICTVDEFNALVEDMTLGLDVNPVNHGHYLNYVDADKALLKNENNTLVYTQEMADDGELPSVGMNCAWNAHTTNVIITFVGEEMFCGENDTGKEVAGYISDLKPIDTRTKKEKAIDEYIQSQHYGPDSLSQSIKTIMKNAFEAGVEWVGE